MLVLAILNYCLYQNLNKMMKTMRILFLVLSAVTTFNCNAVSASDSNNLIEFLLEKLIQKVDLMEKNMEKVSFQVDDLVMDAGQTKKTVNDLVTKVENVERKMAKEGGSNYMLFVDDKCFVFCNSNICEFI